MNCNRTLRRPALFSLLCASLMLAACGGGGSSDSGNNGGGGGGSGGGGSNAKPSASIVFPPADAVYTAEKITIRGIANDSDGSVVSVKVNGTTATSDDGFKSWTAEVSLQQGLNSFSVEVEDNDGSNAASADSVKITRVVQPFGSPASPKLDAANGRLLVVDSGAHALFGVDLETGDRELISGATRGSGVLMRFPRSMDFDAASGVAYVIDAGSWALLAVDAGSGNRSEISSWELGAGAMFLDPYAVALGDNDVAYVLELGGKVHAVDLQTGDRELVSYMGERGAGDAITLAFDIEWDAVRSRLIVGSLYGEVYAIDPISGDRELLASDPPGEILLSGLRSISLDAINNALYVATSTNQSIVLVDLFTGDRSLVTVGGADASGAPLEYAGGVELDAASGRLLLTDYDQDAVLSVDISDGSRTVLASSDDARIGDGDVLPNVRAAVMDVSAGNAYMLTGSAIYKVDLSTGARTLLINGLTAPSTWSPADIASDGNRLLVTTHDHKKLFAVDKTTGARSELGPLGSFTGSLGKMLFDAAGNRVFYQVINEYGVRELSLDTFSEKQFTGDGVGTGPLVRLISAMALDVTRDRMVYALTLPTTMYAASLTTGDRTTLIGSTNSVGSNIGSVTGIAFSSDATEMYVSTNHEEGILRVDPETMESSMLSGPKNGRGPSLGVGRGLALDEERGIAWIGDYAGGALTAVDMLTGDRVIISR